LEPRKFEELITADDRSLRFTSLGLATGGKLSPENAAEFQQRSISMADLITTVPKDTRDSFERLRTLHSYGVLCYDLFTVAEDLRWVVLEQALREKFIEYYEGAIPLVDKNKVPSTFKASTFEAVYEAFRWGGSHAKTGRLQLRSRPRAIPIPLTLGPLLRWARHEGLVHGQRNRRLEEAVYERMRNRFAHGAGFRIGMPNQSAGAIRDAAEIINRLWGALTPGGRLYPAPLQREVLIVGWSPGWPKGEVGSTVTVMRPEQLNESTEPGDWTYICLRAVWQDDQLTEFDARYELTTYPAQLLWGPGPRRDALAWLAAIVPTGDQVDYLDRAFAVRRHAGKVYIPCSAEVMLALPVELRDGAWNIVRADFPNDAFGHVRHLDTGQPCPDQRYGGCPVQDLAAGSWTEVVFATKDLYPNLKESDYSDVHVPRRWSFPETVGYDENPAERVGSS